MYRIFLVLLMLGWDMGEGMLGSCPSEDPHRQLIILESAEKYQEVIEAAKAYIARDPSDYMVYKYLMWASYVAGKKEPNVVTDTFAYLESLRRVDPGNHCVENALGYYYARGKREYQRAQSHLQAAMALNPRHYGPPLEMGWIEHSLRNYDAARKYFEQAFALAKQADDCLGEMDVARQTALLYEDLGNPGKALSYLYDILKLSRSMGKRDREASALVRIAEAHLSLGELKEAEESCNNAIQVHNSYNDSSVWFDYMTRGNIFLAWRDRALAAGDLAVADHAFHKAITDCHQALASTTDAESQQLLRIALGDAYVKGDDLGTAEYYYRAFFDEASRTGALTRDRSQAMGGIGEIHLKNGDYRQALRDFNQATDLAREDKSKGLEMFWRKRRADLSVQQREYDAALKQYEDLLQEVTNGFLEWSSRSERERYVFFGRALKVTVYEDIVDLLLRMDKQQPEKGYARKAFDYVEQARAESMLHVLLQNRGLEMLLQESVTDESRKELDRLRHEIATMHRERTEKIKLKNNSRPASVRTAEAQTAGGPLDSEIKSLEQKIEGKYREMVNLIRRKLRLRGTESAVSKVQDQVLKGTDALIEYMVSNERTFVFILTKDQFAYESLPIGRQGYKVTTTGRKESVATIQKLLHNVSPRLFPAPGEESSDLSYMDARSANIRWDALYELYTRLFQPIEKHLPTGGALTIVPDDVLYYLPFEMLMTDRQWHSDPKRVPYLLRRHAISYAYSAGALLELPVMADPPPHIPVDGESGFWSRCPAGRPIVG